MNIYDHLRVTMYMQELVLSLSQVSANIILGEHNFDNPSNKNIDPPFSLQSILLTFSETELLNSNFVICCFGSHG